MDVSFFSISIIVLLCVSSVSYGNLISLELHFPLSICVNVYTKHLLSHCEYSSSIDYVYLIVSHIMFNLSSIMLSAACLSLTFIVTIKFKYEKKSWCINRIIRYRCSKTML